MSRNINAVFSFSKQILNNNKKSIECIKKLDIRNILLETDSPYQALKFKNQDYTKMQDIINVYQKAFLLCKNESDVKNIQKNEFVNFTDIIYNNFFTYLKNH